MNILFTNGYVIAGVAALVILLLLLARRARRLGSAEDVSALKALEEKTLALMNAGKYDEARNALEHAVEVARSKGQTQYELRFLHNLGVVYFKQSRNAKAVEYFKVVVERLSKQKGSEDFLYLARTNLQRAQFDADAARQTAPKRELRNSDAAVVQNVEPPVDWPVVDTREAQNRINELFRKGDDLYRNHQHGASAEYYSEAVDLCAETVKVDSPYMAAALNRLAMARMGDGYFGHARELLDRAEVIMSEWPGHDNHLHESIAQNQAKCRGEMGF